MNDRIIHNRYQQYDLQKVIKAEKFKMQRDAK